MKKKKIRISTVLLLVLLFVLFCVVAWAGWKLYRYYADYSKDRDLYSDLRDEVIKSEEKENEAEETTKDYLETEEYLDNGTKKYRKRKKRISKSAPISVDWDELKKINEDIIGWVYFTGLPQISYPVLQADDNEYYVHRTYDLSSDTSKAGCIFMDYRMADDFSSPYSIIYGHNVRDGSMLSDLARLKDQTLYDEEPYFWILTPDKNYRYEIISAYTTGVNSDTYTLFKGPGEEFEEYLQKIKSYSDIKTEDTELTIKDKIVTLSTCTGNESTRFVVQGKRVNAEDDGRGENTGSADSDAASVDSVTVQEG